MGTCPAHRRGVLDDRVEVGDDNALRALLDYQGPLAQVFLMELAVGDVAAESLVAGDIARVVEKGPVGPLVDGVRLSGPAVGLLVRLRRPFGRQQCELRGDGFTVFGGKEIEKVFPAQFGPCQTDQLDQRIIDVGQDPARKERADEQRQVFRQPHVLLAALPQLKLVPHAFGDVARNAEHADDVSCAIVQRSLGGGDTAFAVRGGERFFVTM